ncbi:hypothetical protein [Vallitalea okinawensis]|uniref:hypothetical protein n=1 Tax=Vallitalea okinawensis TaxID=2078660 RepID=UPI000CFC193B|nr:hypothetical protein [Vallitalea okinawensis]
MKYISKELNDWAVNKIKTEYLEDVSLLIGHKHWKIKPDGDEVAFNFFIPETDHGYNLSQTFIINEIGYDLFPMSWERVEGLANINETLTTCLADGVILYARSEEDKQRFINLQKKLAENLTNPEFTYVKGLEKINIAMDLYKNMLFDSSLSKVRKASGYLAGYLAQAIATFNGTYFRRGPEDQLTILNNLQHTPKDFTSLYQRIVSAVTLEETKNLCYQMIKVTRDFFSQRSPKKEKQTVEYNFEDLADWYEEGTYTFRRIYYYCDQKDVFNSFAWAYNFQQEFDYLEEEFGMKKMDLIGTFDISDLSALRKRAKEIEHYIVSIIKEHGVVIQEFDNIEEFLMNN